MTLTSCFSRASAVCRVAGCSIFVVMRIFCCLGVAVANMPWMASVFDSVAPEVKMSCLGRQPMSDAVWARAISSFWLAACPRRCAEDGFAQ